MDHDTAAPAQPEQPPAAVENAPLPEPDIPRPLGADVSSPLQAPAPPPPALHADDAIAPVEPAPEPAWSPSDAPETTESPVAAETSPLAEATPAPEPTPAAEPKPAPAPNPALEERRRQAQAAWDHVVAAKDSHETVNGTVTAAVKGGLLVDVGGIRGFLPASQTRVEKGVALDTLVKQKVPLRVIDIDAGRRRIVVSHRKALEGERRARRAELLASLEPGQMREGTVVRLTDFGAFVDLGGVDGLIPMRELAFERVNKAEDVVTVGETLKVEVLRIDENGKKISLSRKNALHDPWRENTQNVRRGATIMGTVVAKEPRLLVEIAEGVTGAVRESDADPNDYEIGEQLEVVVRNVDPRTRRITLTTTHAASFVSNNTATSTGFAPLGVELQQRR